LKDPSNANPELIEEISALKKRIKELEESESSCKKSEKALQKAEKMLHVILDTIPAMIWQKDLDGRYLQVNNAYCRTVGLPEEAILQKTDYDIHPKEIADKYVSHDMKVLTSGKSEFGIEEYHRKPSGDYGWSVTDKLACIDDQGNITGTIGFALDITDQKHTEKALKESEEKYRNIFENSIEGIFRSTPEGCFVSANPAAARMLGYDSPEELISTIKDMGFQLYANPEDRDSLFDSLKKYGFIKNFEVQCYHKNGSIIWGILNVHLVQNDQGNIVYIEGTCQDITGRKQAEEELNKYRNHLEQLVEARTDQLKSSENKYRTLFETSNDSIFLMRSDTIIDCNPKTLELFRRTRGQIIGQTPYSLSPPIQPDGSDSRKKVMKKINSAASGTPQHFEWQHLRSDGTNFDTEINLCVIKVGQEKILYGVIRDISNRKQAEKALKQKENELRAKAEALEEYNTALRVLLHQREEDKKDLEDRVASNVKRLVIPYIEKMKKNHPDPQQLSNLNILEANLNEIVSPFLHTIRQLNLTPRETQIAALIKDGKTTKEIVKIIGVATSSIDSYRNNIRSKLGLKNKKVNLQMYLQSLT